MNRFIFSLTAALVLAVSAKADAPHRHASPYAGQEHRTIKSLSEDDISELRRGGGWGLAKSAELNGLPGPAHLLELKDDIPLAPGQVRAIRALFDSMRAEAMIHGRRLIALEAQLDAGLRKGDMNETVLRAQLREIAEVRSRLRFTHLATHLKTPGILSADQIAAYARLRGYTQADPCAALPPSGHDADMWRKHMGCR